MTPFHFEIIVTATGLAVIVTLFFAAMTLPDESRTSLRQDAAQLGSLLISAGRLAGRLLAVLGGAAGRFLLAALAEFGSFLRGWIRARRLARRGRPVTTLPERTGPKHAKPRRAVAA